MSTTVTITGPKVRTVHPDIPADRAWQEGRRLYARCGIHTTFSGQLHALGAQWDPSRRALWVSTRHRDSFTADAYAHHQRAARASAVRSAGLWVALPYGTDLIRLRIKELGGVWDDASRRWAMPTVEAYDEITIALGLWEQARAAEREAAAEAHREAMRGVWESERQRRAEARLEEAADRCARIVAQAGRAPTGQVHMQREAYARHFGTGQAHEVAHAVGAVVRLDDGRPAVVVDRVVGFIDAASASSYGHDRAHWYAEYRMAVVEPTAAELDAEVERALWKIDAFELRDLVADAALLTLPTADDRWTQIPPEHLAGTITVGTGTTGLIPAGQILLAVDGTVLWQHPGQYDTYIRAEGSSCDPALAERIRSALAAGPRTRAVPGAPPLYYTVTPCPT